MRCAFLTLTTLLVTSPVAAQMYPGGKIQQRDVWQPAATPVGGTPWKVLEATKETTRQDRGIIYSKPVFTPQVRALAGKRIKLAGWMLPLSTRGIQTRFVLLAYPPGCPFHFHAMPNQFVEVLAPAGFQVNETKPLTVTGTLQLTGTDESGVFYRLVDARPG